MRHQICGRGHTRSNGTRYGHDITSTGNEADRAIWTTSNGVGGMLAFPKSEIKDETELKRILQFVNDLLSDEIYALMTYGIEGVH
ncbi:hypothetical protein [Paenibacillus sp. LHD-38]|uniref:hypothetical protein n=1 Tax=Paenibacillus sp. LHD-38 TaxID=3072143 RepID=UPI00280FA06E|nr:hypothetical protein [Paenibacillus sp. LHD-38]MDQ8737959.1 hypothetical protein [Paenibacillus sp. LHD-38]